MCSLFSRKRNVNAPYFLRGKTKPAIDHPKAVGYLRTSSATNAGEDKDSHRRQLVAIEAYAKRAGVPIVAEFYDPAVRGADRLHARPGFAGLLSYLDANPDVRTIVVETADRFARDLIVQETGFALLKQRDINLIATDSPNAFLEDTPRPPSWSARYSGRCY